MSTKTEIVVCRASYCKVLSIIFGGGLFQHPRLISSSDIITEITEVFAVKS